MIHYPLHRLNCRDGTLLLKFHQHCNCSEWFSIRIRRKFHWLYTKYSHVFVRRRGSHVTIRGQIYARFRRREMQLIDRGVKKQRRTSSGVDMDKWENETCIRFLLNHLSTLISSSFVRFGRLGKYEKNIIASSYEVIKRLTIERGC